MKRIFYILIPLLLAVVLFSVVLLLLNSNKGKGALQVTSNQIAKIYLNGKLIGQTVNVEGVMGYRKDLIDEGDYVIKLIPIKGDFLPFEQKITISSKVLTVVDRNFGQTGLENGSVISLTPIPDKKDAQISVVSFPDDTQIFLDNNLEGQSPIILKNITESDHELKLTKEGYKDKIVRIRTILGYRLEMLVFMGINPEVATASATISSPSASIITTTKVLILNTPTGFLRVRETASIAAAEIAQVKPGESYDLLDEKSGWFKIKVSNNISGWISSQYSKKES